MAVTLVPTPHGSMPVLEATPAGDGPWPGVVVLHDLVGVSADLRRQADWLAQHGYLTLAPDLFHWAGRARCLLSTMRDVLRGQGRAFDEVSAVRDALADDRRCTGTVGVVGFCFGGGFAVLLAARPGYAAASVNYGQVTAAGERLLSTACPILGVYGERDAGMASSVRRLEQAAQRPGSPHRVLRYAGAGHAFLNDYDPSELPPVIRIVDRLAGDRSGYHEQAARAARADILDFLQTHLRREGQQPPEAARGEHA